jgi:tRNA(Arg) A34 adenosine deaminase TadA
MDDNNIMLIKTLNFANQHRINKYNLCAIITDKRNNILSIGFNSYKKTHPTQAYYAERAGQTNRIFLHAELDALIRLPTNSTPHSIFIARSDARGRPLLAEPCPICMLAIRDAKIKNIYFTK